MNQEGGDPSAGLGPASASATWSLRIALAAWMLGFCCTFGLSGQYHPEPSESPEQTHRVMVVRAAFAVFPSVVGILALALGIHALLTTRGRRGSAIAGVVLATLYLGLVWVVGPIALRSRYAASERRAAEVK
jgi:hypothetical protein